MSVNERDEERELEREKKRKTMENAPELLQLEIVERCGWARTLTVICTASSNNYYYIIQL